MISESSLAQECTSRTFTRARLVAKNEGFIHHRRCDYEPDGVEVRAVIESMNGWDEYPYDTKVVFNDETGAVIDYECTCQAFNRYPGMCKHIAGLSLLFNQVPETFRGYQAVRGVLTSHSLAAYMHQQESKRVRKTQQPTLESVIELDVNLASSRHDKWAADFKVVGTSASYVIKDFSAFLDDIENGAFHEYGAKLGFTHTMEAFTPQAQSIIAFANRFVSSNASAFKANSWSQAQGTNRYLYLPQSAVVSLLDLLGDTPFSFEDYRHPKAKAKRVRIENADPSIPMTLTPRGDSGWELVRESDMEFVSFGSSLYAWDDAGFYRCTAALEPAARFISTVYAQSDERITVSNDDLPRFCASVLPVLTDVLHVPAPPELAALKPVEGAFSFYLDVTEKGFECEAKVTYADTEFNLLVLGNEPGKPVRDEAAEDTVRRALRRFMPQETTEHCALAATDDDMARLIFQGVDELQAIGEVFTTKAFDGMNKKHRPRLAVGVSIKSGLVDVELTSDGLSLDEIDDLLASYRQKKTYHRLKDGAFLQLDEEAIRALQLERLGVVSDEFGTDLAGGSLQGPLYHAFALEAELEEEQKSESFRAFLNAFEDKRFRSHEVPESLANTLRPYQVTGFKWLNTLFDCHFGGILADEMGLGKSLQVITAILHNRKLLAKVGPALIICPASLVFNWTAEFKKFAPDLRVGALAGSKAKRLETLSCPDYEIIISSYDTARIDIDELAARTFFIEVLDEAQYIKNHTTQAARAVKRIKALNHLALTGTPIENRLSELWSIFDFLMPGMLGPYKNFKERYEVPILDGDQRASERLKAKIGPFILRRLKKDVLTDLPEKMETVVRAQMAPRQQELYEAHERRLLLSLQDKSDDEVKTGKIGILAELTKLRQLCCDPRLLYTDGQVGAKLDVIADLVASAIDSGQKVLVFSQFTSFLEIIGTVLKEHEWSFFTITGSTPKKRRMELVEQFNSDDTPVFLISLKAGGTGLNLVGASIVIHADPWWNAAAQNQATDRAHRIGQTRDVSVFKIIAGDTIEERILDLQEKKSDLADQVLAADGASLSSMSREDIIGLLTND